MTYEHEQKGLSPREREMAEWEETGRDEKSTITPHTIWEKCIPFCIIKINTRYTLTVQ